MSNAANFAAFERELEIEEKREFEGEILRWTKRIALDGYSGVVEKTRVDTGFMVNNWQIEAGGSVTGGASVVAPGSGSISLSEGEAESLKQQMKGQGSFALAGLQPFQVVSITNGAEYAIFHELGTVKMAPQPMVSPTVAELRSKYRNIR